VSQEFTFHGKSPVGSVRFIPSDSLNELTRLVVWIQISPNQWSNDYTHHSGFRAEWTAAFHFSHVYVYFPRSLFFFFFSTHTRVCVCVCVCVCRCSSASTGGNQSLLNAFIDEDQIWYLVWDYTNILIICLIWDKDWNFK